MYRGVELVRFLLALANDVVNVLKRRGAYWGTRGGKAHGQHDGLSRGNIQRVMEASFGPGARGIDGTLAKDNVPMEGVLHVRLAAFVARAKDTRTICLIV